MKDAHIHIERGPYTKEWLMEFVDQAVKMNLTEINLLEHSHRFQEFMPIYQDVVKIGGKMGEWITNKKPRPIKEYYEFIKEMRKLDLPIKVNFGLEVCYFKKHEELIKELLNDFDYDFSIGSLHYVFDVAYDLDGISQKYLWEKYPVDDIYKQYYQDMESLIKSELFDILGHPDTIKMFNYYPTYDQKPTYQRIAELLNKHKMSTENNYGCHYRYHHPDLGLGIEILEIFIKNKVDILTSSDAHSPSDVGCGIVIVNELIKCYNQINTGGI